MNSNLLAYQDIGEGYYIAYYQDVRFVLFSDWVDAYKIIYIPFKICGAKVIGLETRD